MSRRSGIDAVHIMGHGGYGILHLGSTQLSGQNLGLHADALTDMSRRSRNGAGGHVG